MILALVVVVTRLDNPILPSSHPPINANDIQTDTTMGTPLFRNISINRPFRIWLEPPTGKIPSSRCMFRLDKMWT